MKMELLSPAGDILSLKLAIDNGADAVYLGLQNFNARRSADNFNEENIAEYVKYAHLFNTKIYVTLNTNVKDNEIKELESTILACKNAKIDAFIITDFLTAKLVRKLTNIPMHASTQMGVDNVYGAKYLEKLGFNRVVLARETKLEDIKQIKEQTKLELEYFVHGALCVSYSGQCLFSSMISGESANRGLCKQPCRQLYKNLSNNDGYSYLLSTKDLCLISELKKLEEIGIDSLKIEGRLKRPEYVGIVTNSYRIALDNINNNINEKLLLENLKKIYNRGEFTKGYLYNENVMYNKTQNHIGEYAGKIIEIKNNNSILLANDFDEKNGYKIFRDSKELTGGNYKLIKKLSNNKYLINYKGKVGDVFRITTDNNQINKLNEIKRKIIIKIFVKIAKNKKLEITAKYKNICININCEELVEASQNQSITNEDIAKIFNKTGDKHIVCNLKTDIENGCYIKLSTINNLRKEVYCNILNKIVEENTTILQKDFINNNSIDNFNNKEYFILNKSNNIEQIKKQLVAVEINNDEINLPNLIKIDFLIINLKDYNNDTFIFDYYNKIIVENKLNLKLYLKLPTICTSKDLIIIDNILNKYKNIIHGLYSNTIYGYELSIKYNLKLFGGVGLNIYNNTSASNKLLEYFTVSTELNNNEIVNIKNNNKFVYAFGYLPLMTYAHCTNNNGKYNCKNCNQNDNLIFKDKKFYFNIIRNKLNYCYFTLYNSFSTNILDFCNKNNFNIYLDMLQYTNEVNNILNNKKLEGNFTKGNLIRGVK